MMPHGSGSNELHIVPPSSTVGNKITEAVGTAMAQRYRKTKDLTITYFGDGATSEGDFHVGLNFAAVYGSPVIFFCQNNQYAISVRLDEQTHTKTIAEKARAYGMDGYLVDGNDILAVYGVTKLAADKARAAVRRSSRRTPTATVRTHPRTTIRATVRRASWRCGARNAIPSIASAPFWSGRSSG